MLYVIKKDGTREEFNPQKIVAAVNKSAERILYTFSDEEKDFICRFAQEHADSLGKNEIEIQEMHNIVEGALERVNPAVAKSYRDYRNYKLDFIHMMDDVYTKSQAIRYIGDKSNANTDSALVATKRSLIFNELNKELYRKFFMNRNELQACKDGYIYIHDQSARLDTMNCCLFDVAAVLSGGFEMGNVWYNEPKTLDTAFDVMGDIILSTAAQQYGGFTVPEVDKILAPYAKKSYDKYISEFMKYSDESWSGREERAIEYALDKVRRDYDQGWQGIEYKLNTVGSSRGDYPFVTVTLGLGTEQFEKMCTISLLEVHQGGQGKAGHKKPVLFPKIVFLYDKEIHGPGKCCEDIFEAGVECSSKTMYPDWLSMSGAGYISSMYRKYKKVISPMGCRAFLSPWYERGGMEPADDDLLKEKPRNPREGILTRGFMITMITQGLLIAAASMTAYHIGLAVSSAMASTMAFATLTLSRLFHGFNCRGSESIFRLGLTSNRYSLYAFAAGVSLLALVIFIPGLHSVFSIAALPTTALGQIVGLSLLPTVLIQIMKIIRYK